jgi:hypothetical protein
LRRKASGDLQLHLAVERKAGFVSDLKSWTRMVLRLPGVIHEQHAAVGEILHCLRS